MDELMEQQAGRGDEAQARQGRWQPLVITRQAATASHPREVARDDPASRAA
jgi:hypothetical protein